MKTMTFRFEDRLARIVDAEAQAKGTATAAVLEMIADGLRYRMESNDPPVHRHFHEAFSPEGVVQFYSEFLEAVRLRAGVVGPEDRHRFEQAPNGGAWERKGLAGAWAVLDRTERFTPDGIELSLEE